MNQKEKAVVTGGAGFIGSYIVERLIERGYHVIVLDDLSSGKLENIELLLKNESCAFIQDSITNLPTLQKLFQGVNYVFHQAAVPSVLRSIENPLRSHEVNTTGTLNVLLAARDNGVKKVVYASSSSIYGDTPVLPKREDMVINPSSPYAVSKVAGEYYCNIFQQIYGLPTVCLRYFNIYGPRQDPNSEYAAVIPKFIKRVSEGSPPIIFGDGEQTRDFTFVADTAQANILAAESSATGVINIGRGERITLNELAKLVITLFGKNMKPIYQESRPGDVRHSLADITRAKTFGYIPKYSIQEGIKKTIGDIMAC